MVCIVCAGLDMKQVVYSNSVDERSPWSNSHRDPCHQAVCLEAEPLFITESELDVDRTPARIDTKARGDYAITTQPGMPPLYDASVDDCNLTHGTSGRRPRKTHETYMIVSIVVTLCFNAPFGIIAILFSWRAYTRFESGRLPEGRWNANVALALGLSGLVIGVCIVMAVVVYVTNIQTSAKSL